MNDKNADEARGVKGRVEKTLLGEVWGKPVNCGWGGRSTLEQTIHSCQLLVS